MAALDQAGDERAALEGALHHEALVEPGFEVVAQHVLVKQLVEIEAVQRLQRPDGQRIVVADKAQRPDARRSSRRVSSMASVVWARRPSKG